jgi:hypothetical protein
MSTLRVNSVYLNDAGNTTVSIANSWNVAVTSGGQTRLQINNDGNIGIGTSSPVSKLEVNGNISSNTAAYVYSYAGGTSAQVRSGIQLDGTNQQTLFFTGTNERMRIDANGNVGIGSSSPSAYAGYTTLTIDNATNGGVLDLKKAATRVGSLTVGGGDLVVNSLSTNLQMWTNGAERMRIDSSGNIGIGTSSPSSSYRMTVSRAGGNQILVYDGSVGARFQTSGGVAATIGSLDNIPLIFETNTIERSRIDSSGNLLVGGTSGSAVGKDSNIASIYTTAKNGLLVRQTGSTASSYAVVFENSNGTIGTIVTSGSATTYNTSSDYRLKKNVAPLSGGLTTIGALKPVTYDWKIDGSFGEGFIAHELQEIIPLAVSGEKDAINEDGSIKPQGVDYSKIVVHLVAAVQELSAKNDALEARLAALEAK